MTNSPILGDLLEEYREVVRPARVTSPSALQASKRCRLPDSTFYETLKRAEKGENGSR